MREILFRGKRLDNGEWVKGTMYQMGIDLNPFIMPIDKHGASYEVDPSTVGQYTGLDDKNGKKIFEGDIACFNEDNQDPCYCVIKHGEYSLGHIGFYTAWYKGGSAVRYFRKDLGFWVQHGHIEVIGNVHDTPELLEGEG